jgi:hypothetical protein
MSAGGGVFWQQRAVAMSSDAVAARKGRLKQRYDNEFRLVAGWGNLLCLVISSVLKIGFCRRCTLHLHAAAANFLLRRRRRRC